MGRKGRNEGRESREEGEGRGGRRKERRKGACPTNKKSFPRPEKREGDGRTLPFVLLMTFVFCAPCMYSAMDSRQFSHHPTLSPSFDDVMSLCVDAAAQVVKQEPTGISPHHPPRLTAGISPAPPSLLAGAADADNEFVTFRLEPTDNSSGGGGSPDFQTGVGLDMEVSPSSPSDTLRLPSLASDPGRSPGSSESDGSSFPRHGAVAGSAPRSSPGQCKVCGDEATGMYFGALVCVPCKVTFDIHTHL